MEAQKIDMSKKSVFRKNLIHALLDFRDNHENVFVAVDKILNDIIYIELYKHIYVAGKDGDIDKCDLCGHDLRHSIHKKQNK